MELGYSTLNESEIEEHISKLKDQWPGSSYESWQGSGGVSCCCVKSVKTHFMDETILHFALLPATASNLRAMASAKDLLKNNCSNFCHTLCEALGVSFLAARAFQCRSQVSEFGELDVVRVMECLENSFHTKDSPLDPAFVFS